MQRYERGVVVYASLWIYLVVATRFWNGPREWLSVQTNDIGGLLTVWTDLEWFFLLCGSCYVCRHHTFRELVCSLHSRGYTWSLGQTSLTHRIPMTIYDYTCTYLYKCTCTCGCEYVPVLQSQAKQDSSLQVARADLSLGNANTHSSIV